MSKVGRPSIQIDEDQFEKLCGLQATLGEFASFFRCSEDTIERWAKKHYGMDFAEVFRLKRGNGKISLRRLQWRAAEAGNVTMLIWLGKQFLGQTDKQEVTSVTDLDKLTDEELDKKIAEEEKKRGR